ncbi:hypothetical protein [Longispora albida]|uniref:hypothetical protein n=1 Tax=Longispora albida TaxID=203523 RepID=UPI000378E145|nr:hypothetical protein [Longispora albida]
MEALRLVLRYIHLVGFALLLGGFVVQYLSAKFRVNGAMLAGSAIQVVTGVVLSAPFPKDVELDHAKLAVKGVLAVLIAGMVWSVRKKESVAAGHFIAIGGMTLVNAAVATFWR